MKNSNKKMSAIFLRLLIFIAKLLFVISHKFSLKERKSIDKQLKRYVEFVEKKALDYSENLPPFPLTIKDKEIEIHTLLCKKDIGMYLWAIRSLLLYMKIDCPVVVHDDGSLSKDDIKLIGESIPNITIIERKFADKIVEELLENYPSCKEYRERVPWGIQLFDYHLLSNAGWILSFDADILFFRFGDELAKSMKQKDSIVYNNEYGSDVYRKHLILTEMYPDIIKELNAGLLFYPKSSVSLEIIESIVTSLIENKEKIRSFAPLRFGSQIIYAIMLGIKKTRPLSKVYSVNPSSRVGKDNLVCKHFCSGWKMGFWIEGIYTLLARSEFFTEKKS